MSIMMMVMVVVMRMAGHPGVDADSALAGEASRVLHDNAAQAKRFHICPECFFIDFQLTGGDCL